MTVIIKVRYILFIYISWNVKKNMCWQFIEFPLFMLGDLPLYVNYQHEFEFSQSLEYYKNRPLMFKQ